MATKYEVIVDATSVDQKTIRKTESVATDEDFKIADLVAQIEDYRKVINAKIETHNALIDQIAATKKALRLTYTIPYSKIKAIS